jgi:hypothetical protein
MRRLISTLALTAAMAACGQPAATSNDAAAAPATSGAGAANAAVSDADKAEILSALQFPAANARGEVGNACEELVVPKFLPADMGPGVGRAVLFAIGGGANMASCYGDGDNLHLMRNVNGGWTEIWGMQFGVLTILPTMHNNAHDIANGGPGFSFPVDQWNGATYEDAHRSVSDSQLGDATFLP